jgi:hypothetical protein
MKSSYLKNQNKFKFRKLEIHYQKELETLNKKNQIPFFAKSEPNDESETIKNNKTTINQPMFSTKMPSFSNTKNTLLSDAGGQQTTSNMFNSKNKKFDFTSKPNLPTKETPNTNIGLFSQNKTLLFGSNSNLQKNEIQPNPEPTILKESDQKDVKKVENEKPSTNTVNIILHLIKSSLINFVDKDINKVDVHEDLSYKDLLKNIPQNLIGFSRQSNDFNKILTKKNEDLLKWSQKFKQYTNQLTIERKNIDKNKNEEYFDSMGLQHKRKEMQLIRTNIEFYLAMISKLRYIKGTH